jgi:hypothetical protein
MTITAEDVVASKERFTGYIQAQQYKKPPFTVEASGYEKKKGETIPRRIPAAKDQLIALPSPDVTTIYENLVRAAKKFGNAKAMGSRKIVKMHTENKKIKKIVDGKEQEVDKKWTYFELSGYEYITYNEYQQMALNAASGLRNLGVQKDDKMHLYGTTRYVHDAAKPSKQIKLISLLIQRTLAGYVTRCGLPIHTNRNRIRLAGRGGFASFTRSNWLDRNILGPKPHPNLDQSNW